MIDPAKCSCTIPVKTFLSLPVEDQQRIIKEHMEKPCSLPVRPEFTEDGVVTFFGEKGQHE